MMERKALIFNIQKYNTHDGNGVRTLVFFKGCPLRCKWCSNPESQLRQPQVMVQKTLCVNCGACASVCPTGVHIMTPQGHDLDPEKECIGCRACEEACPASALAVVGKLMTISELVAIVEEDRAFYDLSGGGVTLGGGEPLMQHEAAASLLSACLQRGIATAMETCGYTRPETLLKVARHVNLFLFDIKHMDDARHVELTGVHNAPILDNLRLLLDNKHNVKIRMPLLKGLNDGEDTLEALAAFLLPYKGYKNFKGIDILPYHKMGVGKYAQLGRPYPLDGEYDLDEADLERITAVFSRRDIPVTVLKH